MGLVARQDFLACEIEQAVAHGAHVLRQFPGDGGQRNTSVTTVWVFGGHCWHGPCGVPVPRDRANRDTRPALRTGSKPEPIRYDGDLTSQPPANGPPMNAPMAANDLNLMK